MNQDFIPSAQMFFNKGFRRDDLFRAIKQLTVTSFALIGGMATWGCNTQTVVDPSGDTTTFVVFFDADETTGYETSDVYDVDNEIVRFDKASKSIIWAADDRAFQEGNWDVTGNFLGAAQAFQVRFGNVDGQRRAFFTETGPATICDIEPVGDSISISPTNTEVPQ
jgi:hypothetical protein